MAPDHPVQTSLTHPRVDTAGFYPLRAHCADRLSDAANKALFNLWARGFVDQLKALAQDPQADPDLLTTATDIALFIAQSLRPAGAGGDGMEG